MKVTSGWIKDALRRTMLSDQEIVQGLERAGIEIEQVNLSMEIDKRVEVGLVKKVVQHPDADRLKLVEVETGEGSRRVVCAAPNVRPGIRVAYAAIGSTLSGGERIERVKLRGEVSEGMLCSERELGIGLNHNGILEVSSEVAVGTLLCDMYPSDAVIDVKTPANRFDVQSVVGLAREVAAMTSAQVVPLSSPPVGVSEAPGILSDSVQAARYMVARVKVAPPAHSPLAVAGRLRAVGVRSISPVVDVTNYVMLETGQPLHAFDAAKVHLPISVRHARSGEVLTTLDGVRRTLTTADLVIADSQGPIALAGLMGGQSSEVSADTKEIWLESAVFEGVTVRKMAQRHGLRTEASARFERELPTALPPLGLARAVEMLKEIAGGELVMAAQHHGPEAKGRRIELSVDRLSQWLGFGVSYKEAIAALGKLGIESSLLGDFGEKHKKRDGGSAGTIVVPEVPWWRPDLKESADLVEEIVRVIGYDKVPSTIPSWRPERIEFDRERTVLRRLRDAVWAAGAFEVMTYSFVSAEQLADLGLDAREHLKLKNPLSVEQAYLRSSLLPSHLATLERNRMYAKAVWFYELSKVFVKRGVGDQPDEPLRLGVTVFEPEAAYVEIKGLFDAIARTLNLDLAVRAGQMEAYAPGRYGEIWLGDLRVGSIGQLHPMRVRKMKLDGEVAHLELNVAPLLAGARTRPYMPLSAFPAIVRDVAVILPREVTWQVVREATAGWDVSFVGDYYGSGLEPGAKSMTVRLRLSFSDRTPTEQDAVELEEAVVGRLKHKFGAVRRD